MSVVFSKDKSNQAIIDEYLATIPKRSPDDKSDIIVGQGDYTYRILNDWAQVPEGWKLQEVPGIAIDKDDNVYLYNRGEHPVMVFDREGRFLRSWGESFVKNAHGIFIGPDGMVYLADDGDHSVRKCTPEGKVVLTLGTPGKPAKFMSGDPFCRCTDVALSPKGEIYVSDGYFNGRVHKYSPDGKLILSWGGPGNDKGEFNVAHNLICDAQGWVYVADRENHRVQVFDANGKYETQWNNMHRANSIDQDKHSKNVFYVGEGGPDGAANEHMPNMGPSVLVLNEKGEKIARIGTLPKGHGPDRMLSNHGMAVDSRGDIYVGDNALTMWRRGPHGKEEPTKLWALKKLERIKK